MIADIGIRPCIRVDAPLWGSIIDAQKAKKNVAQQKIESSLKSLNSERCGQRTGSPTPHVPVGKVKLILKCLAYINTPQPLLLVHSKRCSLDCTISVSSIFLKTYNSSL
ncbi:hypothetical protein VNO77_25624 [Canavalia gladiata]|uniref:Uncharacterized protein n=1 Tax=Canavalia gladiata TaxID=3824 RepID=A0AAN9QB33_CANGL